MANSINDIQRSIQKAHYIMKLLEYTACNGENWDEETRKIFWAILYDCAKNIKQLLLSHSHGFIPGNQFDESSTLKDIICAIRN